MGNQKHSDGPWHQRMSESKSGISISIMSATGAVVALIKSARGRKKANANLIETAPDMEKSLEAILKKAREEAEEHTKEFGMYDNTTGHTEFGNDSLEEWDCYLWEKHDELEALIKPLLMKARGE